MHVKWLETNRTRKTSWYIVIISTFVVYFELYRYTIMWVNVVSWMHIEIWACYSTWYDLYFIISRWYYLVFLYFIILLWYYLLLSWSLYLLSSMIWYMNELAIPIYSFEKKLDILCNFCDLLCFFNQNIVMCVRTYVMILGRETILWVGEILPSKNDVD